MPKRIARLAMPLPMLSMTAPDSGAERRQAPPAVGSLMVDKRHDRVGLVMGHEGPHVQLRPLQGGLEWDVPPEELREPTRAEAMSAKVAVANGRWGL
ncbi:hypothetical protein [Streptomyces umbrinus]|uniref:hypothetical protein n=1 Tax=Streptomyces umbrinus TaxID=67370 RepID=UPI003C2F8E61